MACWLVLKRRCVCAGGRIRPDCCSGWRTRSAVGRQTRRCPSVRSRCRVSATKEMTCRRVRQRVDHLFSAVGPADATLSGDKKTPTILDRSSGQVYDIKVPTTFLPHTGFAGAWTPATHVELICHRTVFSVPFLAVSLPFSAFPGVFTVFQCLSLRAFTVQGLSSVGSSATSSVKGSHNKAPTICANSSFLVPRLCVDLCGRSWVFCSADRRRR